MLEISDPLTVGIFRFSQKLCNIGIYQVIGLIFLFIFIYYFGNMNGIKVVFDTTKRYFRNKTNFIFSHLEQTIHPAKRS